MSRITDKTRVTILCLTPSHREILLEATERQARGLREDLQRTVDTGSHLGPNSGAADELVEKLEVLEDLRAELLGRGV